MSRNINICKKDEAYTFDEIAFIKEGIASAELIEKLQSLLNAIGKDTSSKAIFFMPLQSFNIFAMLQGDNSICEISADDVTQILKEFSESEKEVVKVNKTFADLLLKKLRVLVDYLNAGNGAKPVCIQADNFSQIEIQ